MKLSLTIAAFFSAAVLFACAAPVNTRKPVEDVDALIRVGMTEEAVLEKLGEPDLVDPYQVGRYIFFYPKQESSDCIADPSSCAAVVFEEGRVIGTGQRGAPERERRPRAAPGRSAPIDPETREEIKRLERHVRQIPAARTMDNLRVYRYLLKLDPGNDRYQKKVARYEAQYRREQDQREALRRKREEKRRRQNLVLRRFEGNDWLQMAIENQGNGRYYVRLHYSGQEPIDILPEHFTLVSKSGRRYACYRCRDLEIRLHPGESAEGRLAFDTYAEPEELIFSHPSAGTVRRLFPEL